jgi:hypothetical protein
MGAVMQDLLCLGGVLSNILYRNKSNISQTCHFKAPEPIELLSSEDFSS